MNYNYKEIIGKSEIRISYAKCRKTNLKIFILITLTAESWRKLWFILADRHPQAFK